MKNKPSVSVLIPVYNEEAFIIKCLDSLNNQTVLPNKFELLVIDGLSTDKTRELVSSWKTSHPDMDVEIVDNPERITPCAFNEGIKKARGEYVTMFGAHSVVGPDFLEKIIETFESHPEIDACGGVVHTKHYNASKISRAIAYIWQHPFGVGRGIRTPSNIVEGYATTVAKITYRKRIFNEIGLFDQNFIRNQDTDMNFRLRNNGGKIWLNPDIETTYFARASVSKMLKTAFYNSYFHSLFIKKHHVIPGVKYIVPGFFVLSLICFLIFGLINDMFLWAFICLLLLHQSVALYSSVPFWRKNKAGLLLLPVLFFSLHFSYGLGFIVGILNFFIFNRKIQALDTR